MNRLNLRASPVVTPALCTALSTTDLSAESASAGQEITATIAGVATAARQTATGATRTQETGVEISRLSEKLQTPVKQFTV